MNEMVVKVIGNPSAEDDELHMYNPAGLGPNGTGDSASTKI